MPYLLAKSCRVPSYKYIVILLLNNDTRLRGLGFSGNESEYGKVILDSLKLAEYSDQLELF